jgi:hypothetical protein
MALEQLGIGRRILVLAFGILFRGIVLAAALAVRLGSQDAVRRALGGRLAGRPSRRPRPSITCKNVGRVLRQ